MQARIRGLVRAGVAVVVLAAAGGAYAQLVPKEEVRGMFAELIKFPEELATYYVDTWSRWWSVTEGIPQGWRYEGEERDGKPHGRGALVASLDKGREFRFEGEFRDGKAHGRGDFEFTSDLRGASRVEGEYRDGKPHGLFVITTQSDYTEIEYRDGKRHGPFVLTERGHSIEGAFRDGKAHGRFLMVGAGDNEGARIDLPVA